MRPIWIIAVTASLLLCIGMSGCRGSKRAEAGPPAARMLYAVASKSKWSLRTATWPNPKPTPLNPHVLGRYRLGSFIRDTQFSTDGTKVLLVATTMLPNGKETELSDINEVGTDLWILDLKANILKPLTTDGFGYQDARWSPDGRYVSAICLEGDDIPGHLEHVAVMMDSTFQYDHNLYVWDTYTGKRAKLAEYVDNAIWFPDSRTIYYEGVEGQRETSIIFRMDVIRRKPTKIVVGNPNVYLGEWSPNGRYLAYITDRVEAGRSGNVLAVLRRGSKEPKLFKDYVSGHMWSPDSRKLLVFSEEGRYRRSDSNLLVLDIATGQVKTLHVVLGEDDGIAAWSRDGKWLIVTRYLKPDPVWSMQVEAYPVDGGKPVVLLTSPERTIAMVWHELTPQEAREEGKP